MRGAIQPHLVFSLPGLAGQVGTNENGWKGLWKVTKTQNLFRIVVIGVTLYFNLAAILKTFVSVSAPLQPIELEANFYILWIFYACSTITLVLAGQQQQCWHNTKRIKMLAAPRLFAFALTK